MTYHFNRILLLANSQGWESPRRRASTGKDKPACLSPRSPTRRASKPVVAYHYLDAGGVLGGFHTAS